MKPHIPRRARRALTALGALGLAGTAAPATATAQQTPPDDAATQSGAGAALSQGAPGTAPVAAAAARRSRSRLSLGSRRLNVRVGRTASISGRVQARSPRIVRLQHRTPGGRWVTLAKDRPDAQGRFTLEHRPTEAGSHRIRVRYSGDEHNLRATRGAGRLNAFRDASASWYGPGFYGRRTACGQTFSAGVMGVAHKTLPCGTRMTLRKGDNLVRVRVIDRGPFAAGRELDLSPAVKSALGFGSTGSVGTTS